MLFEDYCLCRCVRCLVRFLVILTECFFSRRILVLKDGQIVEQGSHKELLALDGIFASMWADQVSSSGDSAHSIADTSIKREVSGYVIDEPGHPTAEQDGIHDTISIGPASSAVMITGVDLDAIPEPSLPPDVPAEHEGFSDPAPITFPMSEVEVSDAQPITISDSTDTPTSLAPVAAEPLTFPTTESGSSQPPEPVASPSQGPAVTFGESVNPSRTGTPDPESEPKRKRISSQNFQRLARKVSLATRRQSSASILPSLKRDNSPRVSVEGRGEGSLRTESPAGSIKSDADKGKPKKKDKKEKSRKVTA